MFQSKDLFCYPEDPGVYLMKDTEGKVLYIGKAKNLKARLKQYFSSSGDQREMVPYLTAQVKTIETIITLSEKDALILENNLIKKHKPKYNILLKDDKSYISLVVTKHKWPMIRLLRFKATPPKNIGTVFGPYTNALTARQTYDLLSRLFPLRQCSDAELISRTRPCLLYEIKRCSGPCVNLCTEEEYKTHVQGAMALLKGQNKEILRQLRSEMEIAAENLEFEKAQQLHQKIHQIEHATQIQHVDHPGAMDCDVLGLHRESDAVLISCLLFREGKIIESEHFSFHLIASSDAEVLESFILQHYIHKGSWPKEIIVPCYLEEKAALEELVSEAAGRKISIHYPEKGKKRDLVEMGEKNAKALFLREQDTKSLREKMLLDIQETLELNRFPRRIECFDTSNLSGTDATASVVSFLNGEKDKSRTRLFKIKELAQADDYTAMKQVLLRHLARQKEKNDFSDLLIVDGGKGHLNICLEVFAELGIASMDCIAVTKDKARHDKGLSEEKVFIPRRKDPILIDPRSKLLFLLQRIRDEAHRTAIEYHRKRRSKRMLSSAIDLIPGIGSVKRTTLLRRFGSVKGIREASRKDLEDVPGLSKRDIEKIFDWRQGL